MPFFLRQILVFTAFAAIGPLALSIADQTPLLAYAGQSVEGPTFWNVIALYIRILLIGGLDGRFHNTRDQNEINRRWVVSSVTLICGLICGMIYASSPLDPGEIIGRGDQYIAHAGAAFLFFTLAYIGASPYPVPKPVLPANKPPSPLIAA